MASFFNSISELFGRNKPPTNDYQTTDVYRDLRLQALTLDPASIGVTSSLEKRVWGVLMETGYPEAVATLVVIADGSVSLYFSHGGGVIGAGEHDGPHKAGQAFLAAAPEFLAYAKLTKNFLLPKQGNTRFYFLTWDGIFTVEAREEDLEDNRTPLTPLFDNGHRVLAQVRVADRKLNGAAVESDTDDDLADTGELIEAATTGDEELVKGLLEAGIDPNVADPTGLSPLMAAAYSGKENTLKLLLEAGSAVDAKDASGYTALLFACNAGQLACTRLLIEQGAGVNERDNDGSTPIMFAAQHGHNEIVRLLLSKGADPTRKGRHGLSAIGFAVQNGHTKTERILRGKE